MEEQTKAEQKIRNTLYQEKQNKIELSAQLRECEAKIHLLNEIVNEFEKEVEQTTHKVEACQNSLFHGTECLESKEEIGFFKDENDKRPSSCTWVKKEVAEKIAAMYLVSP